MQALFCEITKGSGWFWGAVLWISAVTATFSRNFFGLWAEFWELFCGFLQFQLLFLAVFPAFGLVLGAVLGIFAVSATFSCNFSGFWAEFGELF